MEEQHYMDKKNAYQHYAQIYEPQSSPVFFTLANLAKLHEMENILEVGGGSGYMIPTIIQMKKISCQYTMIDISLEYLECAKQRLQLLEQKKDNLQDLYQSPQFLLPKSIKEEYLNEQKLYYRSDIFNINLMKMNIEELNFKENSFDAFFESFVIHHCDWKISLQNVHKVLKKGGKLCMAEFDPDSMEELFEKNQKVDSLLPKLFGDNYKPSCEAKHTNDNNNNEQSEKTEECCGEIKDNNVLSKQQVKSLLEELGFQDILIWHSFVPMTFSRKDIITNYLGEFEPAVAKGLSGEEEQRLREEIYQELVRDKENKMSPAGYKCMLVVATKK